MTPGSAVRLSEGLSSTHLACDDAVDVNTSVTGLVTAFQRTPEAMVAFSFALFTAIRSLLPAGRASHQRNSVYRGDTGLRQESAGQALLHAF